ncbi:hypothetical protein C0989_012414, partial [Termitomyces sp. Mn162]
LELSQRAKSQAEERARAKENNANSNGVMDNPTKGLGPNDKEDALNDAGGFIIKELTTHGRAEPPIMPFQDHLLVLINTKVDREERTGNHRGRGYLRLLK